MDDIVENFLLVAMIITLIVLTYPVGPYIPDKPLVVNNQIIYESNKGGPINGETYKIPK